MIHIIIFSVIALFIFLITFFKLIKENDSNYVFALIPEFIGICIDFAFIFSGKNPNTITFILMYSLSIGIPIINVILRKNSINILEILSIAKAQYYEAKGKKIEAKEILSKNVKRHKNSYLSNKLLAQWYERNNELEKAEYQYSKVIELRPKSYSNYLKLAQIYKQNDKKEQAINILQEVLKNKPEEVEASLLIGDILYSNNMFKEATNIYMQALRYNPGEYKLYYCLGMTYTRLNDFQSAMEYYKKAATINSVIDATKLNLGQISLIFKEYDEAEKYFMECIEIDDEKIQAQAYYYLAKIKLIAGQKEMALQYANIAVETNPKIIKLIEKDSYFIIIMGKIQLKPDRKVKSKLDEKEEKTIKYLNETNTIVEKLTQNSSYEKNNEIEKERDEY